MRTIAVVLALLAVGCGSPDSQEVEDFDGSGGAADGNESGGASSGGSEADGSGGDDSELASGGSATGGEDSGSGGDDSEGSGGDEATGGADQGSGGGEASGGTTAVCDDEACDSTAFQDGTHYCGGEPDEPECLSCAPSWCNCSQSVAWEPGAPNGGACETRKEPSYDTCSTICSLQAL